MDISRQVFQNAYLGYRIFNNHWGKGYGKEGVRLGIDIAFKDLKLHRLEGPFRRHGLQFIPET